ncbi:tRNA-dihydrouridine synthase family protein [bacterium]|nr:tRNA-dihydrouridine synthase family protein [bacterium]MBU1071641.1 tRNA-dihydrouridine synthase family protein [bacterium]MBU1674626.1 tRNA-dihydrouridine synthase family protein [bacterium]
MSGRKNAQELFRDVVALAPMATGGNLPYRRLCREFGAEMTCSEMILAHKLAKGSRRELPLLRRHEAESPFGIQIAAGKPAAMGEGVRAAAQHGPDYIDLNFGCPIDVMVRRGIGAAALQRPSRLAAMVAAARAATDLPLLVKLRSGWSERKVNAVETARIAAAEGADALCVHGRTREQRYRRDADWTIIGAVADAVDIPVLGNGDILLPGDRTRRLAQTRISGVVVARGALIKPWIFRELRSGVVWHPTVEQRWAVMRRYFELAAEHFGDDATGLARVERFLTWHLGFWHRYRPYTDADQAAAPSSLIQHRDAFETDDPELRLLASDRADDQRLIWDRLLDRDHPGA